MSMEDKSTFSCFGLSPQEEELRIKLRHQEERIAALQRDSTRLRKERDELDRKFKAYGVALKALVGVLDEGAVEEGE